VDAGYHGVRFPRCNGPLMAEPRSPLKEFRHLDEKLKAVGLSPTERGRWESLKTLVGPSSAPASAPGKVVGGFDVEAASEALRASLVPAGLRTASPPAEPPPGPAQDLPAVDEWVAASGWNGQAADLGDPVAVEWAQEAVATPGFEEGGAPPPAAVPWEVGPLSEAVPPFDPNAPPPEGAVWDTQGDGQASGEQAPPEGYDAVAWDAAPAGWQAPAPEAGWAQGPVTASEWNSPQPGEENPPPAAPANDGSAAPEGWDAGASPDPSEAVADDTWDPSSLAGEMPQDWEPPRPVGDPSWMTAAAAPGEPDPGHGYGARAELFHSTPAELASWEQGSPEGLAPTGESVDPVGAEATAAWPVDPSGLAAPAPDVGGYVEFETGDVVEAGSAAVPPPLSPPESPPAVVEEPAEELVEEVSLHEITLEDAVLIAEVEAAGPDLPGPEKSFAVDRLAEAAHAAPIAVTEEPLPGAELLGDISSSAVAAPQESLAAVPEGEPQVPPAAPEETTGKLFGADEVEGFTLEADQIGGPGFAEPAAFEGAPAHLDRSIDFSPPHVADVELAPASEFLSMVADSPQGTESLAVEEITDDAIPEVAAEDIEEIVEEVPAQGFAGAKPPHAPPQAPVEPKAAHKVPPPQAPPSFEAPAWPAVPEPVESVEAPIGDVVSLEEIAVTPPPPHAEALGPPLPLPPIVSAEAKAPAVALEVAPPALGPSGAPSLRAPAAFPAPVPVVPEPPFVEAPDRAPPPPARTASPRSGPAFALPARTPPLTPLTDLSDLAEPGAAADSQGSASFVSGEHRVVMHTVEGQVLRGAIRDVDLVDGEVPLLQPSGDTVAIGSDRVKAIFFMLAPGETPPPSLGTKVRVTFGDGRQVAGMSPDYSPGAVGFFVVPVDSRTNTGRIWVYRSAVRQISVG